MQCLIPQSGWQSTFEVWGREGIKSWEKEGKHLGCFNFTVFMGMEKILCLYQK